MNRGIFTVLENSKVADRTFRMELTGDVSEIKRPGQFVNIKIEGFFLRRPISVCDIRGNILTIIYKTVGSGTEKMSAMHGGEKLDVLCGLGNGYDTGRSGGNPVLIGGGVGVPPLLFLTKKLVSEGKKVRVLLGFNTATEVFLEKEFTDAGASAEVATADGSYGAKGFVTDIIGNEDYSYFYACGPEAMLRAVYFKTVTDGQMSFERRMGCGFGACMGCTCKTVTGNKRICREGPVLEKGEIIWGD